MVAVAVKDNPGEAVGFAPDEPVYRFRETEGFAIVPGSLEPALKEIGIEVLFPAGDPTGDDLGCRVVDGGAEWPVAVRDQFDDIARLGVAGDPLNLAGVDPLVPVKDP